MYCPKCGTELKSGLAFCPKCGAKLSGNAASNGAGKKPCLPRSASLNTAFSGIKMETSGSRGGTLASLHLRRAIPFVIGCAAVLLVLALLLLRPSTTPADADLMPVLTEYLENQTYAPENQALFQECLSHEVDDLLSQLSGRLSSMLETVGITLDGGEKKEWLGTLEDGFSEYIKQNPRNQQTFAAAVADCSEVAIVKQSKKGKKLRAEVTVRYLDISAVNQKLLEDTLSAENLVSLLLGGSWKQALMGFTFSSDKAEYLLGSFLETAESAGKRKTYSGTVTFSYNKETERWEVSSVDEKLLQAYFAVK